MTTAVFSNRNSMRPNAKLFTFLTVLLIHAQLAYGNWSWERSWSRESRSSEYSDYNSNESSFSSADTSSSSADTSSIELSTPEDCARVCTNNGKPLNCYYTFTVEFYTTVGPACNMTKQRDQCIQADGVERTLIPINRQLPGPTIQTCRYDRIIVDVKNSAPGLAITIHWHGLAQHGFQYYDGVPYVTQCPIPSSSTFRYDFVAGNSGTHFYHSHMSTHMLDGQYGPLIVKDPPALDPHYHLYDADRHVMLLSDWTHELSLERYPGWYRYDVGQSAQNILINGLGNGTNPRTNKTTNGKLAEFSVERGKRYRIRVINSFSTVCPAELSIDKHRMVIIAQDGANVKPKPVDKIITTAGERVDFILIATQPVDAYWIRVRGLEECALNAVQQFAILKYQNGPGRPMLRTPEYSSTKAGVEYNSLDATQCDTNNTRSAVCVNQVESVEPDTELLKVEPDERHILPFWFFNYTQYGNKLLFGTDTYKTFFDALDYSQLVSTFNNIEYENTASPLLTQPSSYQTICRQNQLNNCTEPCTCTQIINTNLNNIVELVIYDQVPLPGLHHPFHLHGYEFKVFSVGQFTDNRNLSSVDIQSVIENHTDRLARGLYHNPPGKDTIKIPTGGYAILRFKASNPGWWLLHCHFTWHHVTGMELVIHVGTNQDLPPIPPGFPQCNNWRPALHTLNEFYGFRYPHN